jgi:hypothetical protein
LVTRSAARADTIPLGTPIARAIIAPRTIAGRDVFMDPPPSCLSEFDRPPPEGPWKTLGSHSLKLSQYCSRYLVQKYNSCSKSTC